MKYLSLLWINLFCLTLPANSESEVIKPDEKGVLTLEVEKAELTGVRTVEKDGIIITSPSRDKEFHAVWQIDTSTAGAYLVEVNYASPHVSSEILIEVNGKKWWNGSLSNTRYHNTESWTYGLSNHRRSDKKQHLQKGTSTLTVSLPSSAEKYFQLHSIRLIPASLESKIMVLRNSSFFGMSLYDMELVRGKGMPVEFDLEENCERAGEDPALYGNLNLQTTTYLWRENYSEEITASFLNDKCIAVNFKSDSMDDILKALKETQRFLPKIQFTSKGYQKGKIFNNYSSGKAYRFQYSDKNFTLFHVRAVEDARK